MRIHSLFEAGWLKARPLAWKITAICVLTLALPMCILSGTFILQANRTHYENQRQACQDYLRAIAENIAERALLIEESASYLSNISVLSEYLGRDFHLTARDVLNLNNTVYPSVDLVRSLHRDLIHSITVYSNNPTQPELGRMFQDRAHITDPKLLAFIESGETSGWLLDAEDPGARYESMLGMRTASVNLFVRKLFAADGRLIGVIALATRDNQLYAAQDSLGEAAGYTLHIMTGGQDAAGMLVESIPRIGMRIGVSESALATGEGNAARLLFIVLATLLGLTLLATFVRLAVARLLGRMKGVIDAMGQVAMGRFGARIRETSEDEIGLIIRQCNHLLALLEKTVNESLETERRQRDAQLEALQYQINPHFIYNAMYLLQLSLEKEGNLRASNAVSWLAEILHYNVGGTMFTTFAEEIWHIRTYLKYVNTFREQPIELHVACPEALEHTRFLRFIFQPLVENAIKYGGACVHTIDILIREEAGRLSVAVRNDGERLADDDMLRINRALASDRAGTERVYHHVGLNNIARRLRLFFGREAGIALSNAESTCVHIHLPREGGTHGDSDSDRR